jgi:hypothetical protein
MALTRLKNIITSRTGRLIYVNPDDFDASDAIDNRGNSPLRPFKSLQRALLEVARFSYRGGRGNDEFDAFSILLHPSEYIIDNRPGRGENQDIPVLNENSNYDLLDPSNDLYKFNSITGGVIIPRGCSIIGLDLRRTKIIPKYVPYPYANPVAGYTEQDRSAVFRVTGGCYFWQFSIFDGHNLGVYYNKDISTTIQPNYSHHKLTVFEYASLPDLELYYKKVSIAFTDIPDTTGSISQDQFQPRIEENRIVGPISDIFQISRITRSGKRATAAVVDSQGNPVNHGFSVGTTINISGAREGASQNESELYNGSFVVISSNADIFSYEMRAVPSADATNSGIQVRVEIDTVDSASPYIFNCSLRSTWGLCGLWADGAKSTGFKSMVVAQYTGISLQKDDNVFVRWNGSTYENAGKDAHLKGSSRYKKGMRNFHIRASNDAFIQSVSVFAVGYADHFLCESGGDMSITNSNSNFGNTAIRSVGFKAEPFSKDSQGRIVGIIPPKNINAFEEVNLSWIALDLKKTLNSTNNPLTGNAGSFTPAGTTVKLYLYGYGRPESSSDTTPTAPPPYKIQGYTVGARRDVDGTPDKIFLSVIDNNGNAVVKNSRISPSYSFTDVQNQVQVERLVVNTPPGSVAFSDGVSQVGPIRWDPVAKNWYILTESNSNEIFQTLINNTNIYVNASGSTTTAKANIDFSSAAFIKRQQDLRNLKDRIYRIKYVIPRSSTITPRDPISGYVIKPRKTSIALGNAWTDDISNVYYIYEVDKIQTWEQNKSDGIYHLTVLSADITPTDAQVNDRKFSQNVNEVYPQFDRDNPRSNPKASLSVADNFILGSVKSTDKDSPTDPTFKFDPLRSITRETVSKLLLDIYTISQLNDDLKMVTGTLLVNNVPQDTTTNYETVGKLEPEERLFPLVSNQQKDVELRRPSTVRSGNHTFEYLGFGPGNYSNAFPSSQEETLTDDQVRYSQSIKEQAGIAFYSGLNSNGDLFIGNSKINPVTGQVTQDDIAQLNVVGEEGATINTFGEVVITDRLTVVGGSGNNLQTFFSGPVTFENALTSNNEIRAKKLTYFWTSPGTGTDTQSRSTFLAKQTAGGQPDFTATYGSTISLSFNDGDIAYNIDLETSTANMYRNFGWVYLNDVWIPFGLVGSDAFRIRDFSSTSTPNRNVGIGTDAVSGYKLKVGGNQNITENLDVNGKHGFNTPYSYGVSIPTGVENGILYSNLESRYISRRYNYNMSTGGTQNFNITPGHKPESILVFVNGVRQLPYEDYNIVNDQLTINLTAGSSYNNEEVTSLVQATTPVVRLDILELPL